MSFAFSDDLLDGIGSLIKRDADLWNEFEANGAESAGLLLNIRAAPPDELGFSEKDYWGSLKAELREFICTNSEKYSADRERIRAIEPTISKAVIPAIAAAVGSTLGIAAGVATPFVAIALFGATKIGVNTWCRASGGFSD